MSSPDRTEPCGGFWGRLVARFRSWFEIPYGYEDQYGFHYGHEPRPAGAAQVFTDRASDAMGFHSPVASEASPREPQRVTS